MCCLSRVLTSSSCSIIKLRNQGDHGQHAFFATLSTELFRNVHYLFQQIDAQFSNRSPDESVGAQIAAFCVYSCGVFSAYLCKYPGRESTPNPPPSQSPYPPS